MFRAALWFLFAGLVAATCPPALLAQDKPQAATASGSASKPAEPSNYRIYGLKGISNDAEFCSWVAETIPMAVQPETWRWAGGSGNLSYNAATKTLVVYHTSDVHTQVEAYLKSMKRTAIEEPAALPAAVKGQQAGVVRAQFTTPQTMQASETAPGNSYLIPTPARQPKHLFHFVLRFEGDGAPDVSGPQPGKDDAGADAVVAQAQDAINKAIQDADIGPLRGLPGLAKAKNLFHCIIRYEGEGIIDSNVVELFKAYAAAENDGQQKAPLDMAVPPPPASEPKSDGQGTQKKETGPRPVAPNITPPPVDTTLVPPARAIPSSSVTRSRSEFRAK